MFNVKFLKQLSLLLILVLNWIVLIFIYVGTFYKNIIQFFFEFLKEIYFRVYCQFDTSRAKRWGRQFKPILITKKKAKKLTNFIYNLFCFCICLIIFIIPLIICYEGNYHGNLIISRLLFINNVFVFKRKLLFYADLKNIYIFIEFSLYKYLILITSFTILITPIILITIYFSEIIIRFWFNIIKNSFYFLVILYFILFIIIVIKFLLILSLHMFLNASYHLFLCILISKNFYVLILSCWDIAFKIIVHLFKEFIVAEVSNFITPKINALVHWITSSHFYLILNLVIELITQTIPNLVINLIIKVSLFIKQLISMNNPLVVVILNLIVIILFILIGGIIPLVERKYLSLIQRRVGPKFVGYNGRLQFIADALKLLFKEIIFLINTNKVSFVVIPIFLLNLNIFLLINLVWVNNLFYIDNEYFILLILLIELLTSIYTAYIGFVVKNKYTVIASTRVLNGVIVFEIFLITIYFYLYIINSKLSLDNIYFNQIFNLKIKVNLIILPPIVYAVLLNLKKVPFDIIEAETELIMGYTTEHSGFLGGALLLIEYLHLFFWSLLILTLFLI